MPDVDDISLLREYVVSSSEAAFARVVQRHVNLVYSVALRLTGNAEDAQDIVQAVFIVLARKAAQISSKTILTGWLYETTRFTAMSFLTRKNRRQAREQEAYRQSMLDDAETKIVWRQLAPLLENAMSRLSEKDRTLVALHFYENRSMAETAGLMGINEWAARKRGERIMEKLRAWFSKHGVTSTASVIAGAISSNSIQAAPIGLAKTISSVAALKGATASASTLTLVKGALKIMAWTKAQTAIVGIVIVGMATYSVMQHQTQVKLREQNDALQHQLGRLSQLETENRNLSNQLARVRYSNVGNLLQPQAPEQPTNQIQSASPPPAQPESNAVSSIRIEIPKNSWTNAGFATPQATLQSWRAAVLNGDRALFARSIHLTDGARKMIEDQVIQMASASTDPNKAAYIQQAINENWGAEEAILMPMMAANQNNGFTGCQILSQKSLSPNEMISQVETDRASGPPQTEPLDFQRFGSDWKIVLDENYVRQQMAK